MVSVSSEICVESGAFRMRFFLASDDPEERWMAYYIRISKLAESSDSVLYVFEGGHDRKGQLSLDKRSGKAALV